jgi:hypothetical protein
VFLSFIADNTFTGLDYEEHGGILYPELSFLLCSVAETTTLDRE